MEGYIKGNATLPTVHNESVFVTAVIDTPEDRDVIILNIAGVFLHMLTKDKIIVSIRGSLVETMVPLDPERCCLHVTYGKKRSADVIHENEQGALWATKLGAGLPPQTLSQRLHNEPI